MHSILKDEEYNGGENDELLFESDGIGKSQ